MRFHNPQILYALLFLVIPVLVHLFKFRRFKKVLFPNVSFLFMVEKESRKSRKLKKYLILFVRMMIFALVVMAFAGPYFPSAEKNIEKKYIVFDHSPSTLFNRDGQTIRQVLMADLQKIIKANESYVFMDGNRREPMTGEEIQRLMQKENTSPYVFSHADQITFLTRTDTSVKRVFYLSDGQFFTRDNLNQIGKDSLSEYYLIFQKPLFPANAYVDTLYLTHKDLDSYGLAAVIEAYGHSFDLSVELKGDNKTLFKQRIRTEKTFRDTVYFEIPQKYRLKYGQIHLSGDTEISFDNDLFFKIPQPLEYKVLILADQEPVYLKSLFNRDNFNLQTGKPAGFSWDRLSSFDLLVLKGWKPYYNFDFIKRFSIRKPVIFIPDYSANDLIFYRKMGLTDLKTDTVRRNIDFIYYDHPFFKDVFQKKMKNFHAPYAKKYYKSSKTKGEVLLGMTGGIPFLVKQKNILFFMSDLSLPFSNFYLSPLVVPVFYKPLYGNTPQNSLYRYLAPSLSMNLNVPPSETPVRILGEGISFIPYQEFKNGKTTLFADNRLKRPGIYYLVRGNDTLDTAAFNYNREESRLQYFDGKIQGSNIHFLSGDSLQVSEFTRKSTDLSRILLIVAFLFLLAEMLILRFWKWK